MNKLIKTFVVANVIFSLSGAAALAQTAEPVRLDKKPNLVCMQNAVVKRDDAIIAAASKYSAEIIKALEVRRDALKAAWGIESADERNKALKAAWDVFRASKKKSVDAWREARRSAWRQFQVDRKACRVRVASDDHINAKIEVSL